MPERRGSGCGHNLVAELLLAGFCFRDGLDDIWDTVRRRPCDGELSRLFNIVVPQAAAADDGVESIADVSPPEADGFGGLGPQYKFKAEVMRARQEVRLVSSGWRDALRLFLPLELAQVMGP